MSGPVLTWLGETQPEFGPAGALAEDGPWRTARDVRGVQWLLLDVADSGTNTVSREVLEELDKQLNALRADPPEGLVIRSAKPGGFAAGADISMLRDMSEPRDARALLSRGHAVLDRLAGLGFPTVCVVHGAALGAGFELALACDCIIAVEGASFGFPEVNLGLHPGLGGTFRLPARIDPIEAMTMMLTGKTARTARARKLGIADAVVPERHVDAAVRAAIAGKLDHDGPGLTGRAMTVPGARRLAGARMRARTREKAPQDHYPAPYALIGLWEEHGDDAKAMQRGEIASFADLLSSRTSQNLMRAFFLRQTLKQAARGKDTIGHVHVAGGGVMGADIAALCAIRGKTVTLFDPDPKALARAVERAAAMCAEKHLDGLETRDALDRLIPDPAQYGVKRADLVIEAGPEDPETKARIHAGLEPEMNPNATLASNTSSLSLSALAKTLKRPGRFAGLHFFNPVASMQLVEVVRHANTFRTVTDQLAAFCGTLDKLPAHVTDRPGFLVNRALTPYLLEAIKLIDEGVEKETIDHAAVAFGMPMGPVELADRVGLDICLDVADSLHDNLDKPLPEVPGWLREKVREQGEVGRKSGKGLYIWQDDGTLQRNGAGPPPHPDLTDRLILPMLNACVECLRKNVAADPETVDGAMIFATGFAPFRGGPMRYSRTRGIDAIHRRLHGLAALYGDRFTPDAGWLDLESDDL